MWALSWKGHTSQLLHWLLLWEEWGKKWLFFWDLNLKKKHQDIIVEIQEKSHKLKKKKVYQPICGNKERKAGLLTHLGSNLWKAVCSVFLCQDQVPARRKDRLLDAQVTTLPFAVCWTDHEKTTRVTEKKDISWDNQNIGSTKPQCPEEWQKKRKPFTHFFHTLLDTHKTQSFWGFFKLRPSYFFTLAANSCIVV